MADTQPQFKRQISAAGYANTSDGDAVASAPTWTVGDGVPTAAEADGSMYTQKDATDGDDAIYVRVAGAWVPILGQTA